MPATRYDILIEKRACYDLTLSLTNDSGSPYNLSGLNITGQIRRDFDNALQGVFNYSVINSGSGIVKLSLGTGDTYNMDVAASSYDVFIDGISGCSEKLIYGIATISGNKTL